MAKMDLTSRYLKRFKNITLDKTDLQLGSNNYSESDSDEEIEKTRNDLFIIDKTPISVQISQMPEILADLPESNKLTISENMANERPTRSFSTDLNEKDSEKDDASDEDSNDSFVIDNAALVNEEEKPLPELLADLPKSEVNSETSKTKRFQFPSLMEPGIDLNDTYLIVNPEKKPKEATSRLTQLSLKLAEKRKLLSKSVLKPGFEQQYTVPPYIESVWKKKKEKKAEREKTKGYKWFNMPAPEMTEELKNDLKVLQMRKALDPKQFYKKNDRAVPPKYFQVGTVVEGAADFYHARVPKKDRKRTMVEELLADAEFRKFSKRKYAEVLASKPQRKGAQKHMKRLKKKKK